MKQSCTVWENAMSFNRRTVLQVGTALAASSALAGSSLLEFAKAWAQTAPWKPEPKAQLSLLRWKRFIQSEEDAFMELVANFTKATGVKVNVTNESLDDVQPKASVAANTGQGPDMFWGLYSLPHLFPQKVVDLTDVADYLGKKYGGWVPSAVTYGTSGNRWIGIPVAYNGNVMNYRQSSSAKAGFKTFPKTTDELLAYARAMKAQGTPGGMALGHASGDGNAWVHWCLWAFGGNLVDKNDKVIIDSPETEKALGYAKQLYEQMIPGVASWNDSFNNRAFLANEVHWTNNGVSIYAAAKVDPTKKEIAEDVQHALWPIGPVGKPTEFHVAYPIMVMSYSKFPMASKAFISFMMEAQNLDPWVQKSVGYLTPGLTAYEKNPVWTDDPKLTVCRDVAKNTLTAGHLGSVGEKSAAALADFIVLDMFANVCTGREDPKAAMKIAARQAQRLYRS
jgi:multiple sugar transport system substrate-binding protein